MRRYDCFQWAGALAKAMLVAFGLIALSACSGISMPDEAAPAKLSNPTEGYLIEPGNRVRITVFNEVNLSGDYTLDPGGNISMPLLGNLQASGLTSKQLANRIADLLKKGNLYQDPQVAAEVQTFRPVYVLGEVRQPGEFPYTLGMTVLSAIAKAGGYDFRARQGEVVLVRSIGDEQKDYRATERTPILPGDIVRVLQRHF